MLRQNAAGDIAAQPAVAVDVDRLFGVQLADAVAQRIQRDVNGARNAPVRHLFVGAGVQQRHTAVARQRVHLVPVELAHGAGEHIFNHKARHVHRVFGRAVRRRVGKLQLGEVEPGHARANGGGQHVDALVHPVKPDDLCAQQAAGFGVKQHLDRHVGGTGVVACMVGREGDGAVVGKARRLCRFFVETGGGRRHVKQFKHGRALHAGKVAFAPADVIRRNAALLVGRARKGQQGGLLGENAVHLHRVAHGIDIGVGGLHAVGHFN